MATTAIAFGQSIRRWIQAQITFCVRGVISPALSNCALDGLERLLKEKFPTNKPLSSFGGKFPCVNLIRYADGTPVQTST